MEVLVSGRPVAVLRVVFVFKPIDVRKAEAGSVEGRRLLSQALLVPWSFSGGACWASSTKSRNLSPADGHFQVARGVFPEWGAHGKPAGAASGPSRPGLLLLSRS